MNGENPIDKRVNSFWKTLVTSKIVLGLILIVSIYFLFMGTVAICVGAFEADKIKAEILALGIIIFVPSLLLILLIIRQFKRLKKQSIKDV